MHGACIGILKWSTWYP